MMVNNSPNINKNHLLPKMLADIGGIVDHHSMSLSGRWCLLILVELLTITQ
jgi:hypothetical protein